MFFTDCLIGIYVDFMGFDLYAREDGNRYRHAYTFVPSSRATLVISKGVEFDDYYDTCPTILLLTQGALFAFENSDNKCNDCSQSGRQGG